MLSFWEKQSFTNYDVAVVGGGIVGLSTAAVLLERKPNLNVVVLERGVLPSGASTKNAGFACFGSLTEIAADVQKMGARAALDVVSLRWEGLALLRKRLGDAALDFLPYGGYEILFDSTDIYEDSRLKTNEILREIFNEDVFIFQNDKINEFGFDSTRVKGVVYNRLEGQINSGKMMRALMHYVSERGGVILTGAPVQKIDETDSGVEIALPDFAVRADKLALCTNAFTRQWFPEWDVTPGRGQVLVTEVIPNLKLKGCFHFEEGFYYARDYYNRIIFGGGRNLDFETETTTNFGITEKISQALDAYLYETLIPYARPKIEARWSGIMAFGAEKSPIVKRVSPRIVAGVRMNGMGVAIGSKIAEMLADFLLD